VLKILIKPSVARKLTCLGYEMSEIKMMSASKQEPEDQLDEEEERRTK